MGIVVQKYGGSSVADIEKMKLVAQRIVETKKRGKDVVVVVSAMGKTTDYLLDMAKKITPYPDRRELDMLLSTGEQVSIALLTIAIHSLGFDAISFTGGQVGILTTSDFTNARILKINTDKILKALGEGKIVVVAGFQGVDEDYNITTLGRGGSDTTAVALAAALNAEICEIYTDVEGIFTADPRIVPNAQKWSVLPVDDMLELASMGAKLHSRSVIFAKKYNVPLVVRSTFSRDPGTYILPEVKGMESIVVTGVALKKDEMRVNIRGVPDRPGIAAKIFSEIAKEGIVVNLIVQGIGHGGKSEISFTVPKTEEDKVKRIMEKLKEELGAEEVLYDKDIAIISIVGTGMRSHYGVAANVFSALAEKQINIEMISTSEIKISVVVKLDKAEEAVKAIHDKFNLAQIALEKSKELLEKNQIPSS